MLRFRAVVILSSILASGQVFCRAQENGAQQPEVQKANAQESAATPAPLAPSQEKVAPQEEKAGAAKAPEQKKAAEPTPAQTVADAAESSGKFKMTFVYTPWKEVIEFLADKADLDILAEKYPRGNCFHRVVDKEYTAQEAIDELNGQLLLQGFTMIVVDRRLIVRDLADPLPEDFIPRFSPEELDGIGRYRLAKCNFSFTRFTPAEIQAELGAILSGWAKMQVLPKTRQVVVIETGENLRKIRDILSDNVDLTGFKAIQLKTISPDEAIAIIRVLMRFPVGQDSAADGSLSVAADSGGMRLLVTGNPEKVKQLEDILKVLDPPNPIGEKGPEAPELLVYPITNADPTQCLRVLESILSGNPGVRLAVDTTNDTITLLASPTLQKQARQTLDKLQGMAHEFEVFNLKRFSAEEAKALLDAQFGGGEEGTKKNAPSIIANLSTQQLYVRGTSVQVKEIRDTLSKLDAITEDKTSETSGSKVRTIPSLTGRNLDRTLQQLQLQWNLTRRNRINVVYPDGMKRSEGIRSSTPGGAEPPESPEKVEDAANRSTRYEKPTNRKSSSAEPAGKTTGLPLKSEFRLVTWQDPARQTNHAKERAQERASDRTTISSQEAPDVTITIGPTGIILSSDDTEALDELEEIILAIQNQHRSAVDDFTVIYLKHSKADATSDLLKEIIGGADAVSGGGGGLLGGIANAALGQQAGGMMNALMGSGGSGADAFSSGVTTAGPVTIVPDTRLNALFVQAAPMDLDLIEQLVAVIDQSDGPQEPLIAGETRIIRLAHAKAEDVATTIKNSFPAELFTSAGQQGQNRGGPEMALMQLFQGGARGGRGGAANQRRQQEGPKITIGTDAKNNYLIVTAPDKLYKQVQDLAIELDAGAQDFSLQAIEIYKPKRANPSTMKNAAVAVLGLRSNSTSGTGATPQTTATAADDALRRARQQQGQGGVPTGGFGPAGGFQGPGGTFMFGPGGGGPGGGAFGGQGGRGFGAAPGGFGGGQGGFGGGQGGLGGGTQGGRGGQGGGGGRGGQGGGRGGAGGT